MDRREVLLASCATIAGAVLGTNAEAAGTTPFFMRRHLPIGLQLYTLDPDLDRDFAGTLQAIRRVGFRSVEMAGDHGHDAAALRGAFDRAGLVCTSAHIQPSPRGNGASFADVDALARDMHVIGVSDVILPIPLFPTDFRPKTQTNAGDGFRQSGMAMKRDDWMRTADFLNDKGRALKPHGLRVGYHNHNFEFAPLAGGEHGFDILLGHTDPALISFEMDVGWVEAGGRDPMALLHAHPHRFAQMHVKDIERSTETNYAVRQDPVEVGAGKIDWRHILPAAFAANVRRFYVEQEPPFSGPRLASVAKSFEYLAALQTA